MEAKELRIGNWVKNKINLNEYEATLHIIEGVLHSPEYYAPIALTEEWLLKFGFGKLPNRGKYKHPNLHLEVIKGNGFYLQEVQPELIYVHQIQNLYFALTGQELTIQQKASV